MIFDNTNINFGIKTDSAFCRYFVAAESQQKFLLIHCRRCQKCSFYSFSKPVRYFTVRFCHLLKFFGFMRNTLRFTVSQRNNNTEFFTLINHKCSFNFTVCHCNPTSVKPELLSFQNQSLSVVTAGFIE